MEIWGYGEDALTLWALKNRMSEILHQIFKTYYRTWIQKPHWEWEEFLIEALERLKREVINKPTPPVNSLLSRNLKTVLTKLTRAANRSTQSVLIKTPRLHSPNRANRL